MLQTLDDVPWAELEHAYGPATDVPGLLRALASPDDEARERALYEFYGNIWHQGTVYQATAHAVPFLVELLRHPAVQGKAEILVLLMHLADGRSYLDVHQHYDDEVRTPAWHEQLRQELAWVRAAHEAVRAGLPAYLELLEAADPAARAAAASLLACFPDAGPAVTRRLLARLGAEGDTHARACLLLGLGAAADPGRQVRRRIAQLLPRERDPFVRLCAAMAAARLAREETPPEAVEILVDAIGAPEPVAAAYAQLPWADDPVVAVVGEYLAKAGDSYRPHLIALLAAALARSQGDSAVEVVAALAGLAFGQGPRSAGLTAEQRRALDAIAASDAAWALGGGREVADVLSSYDLPASRRKLRVFLAAGSG